MKLIDLLVQELDFWPSCMEEAARIKTSPHYRWVDTGGIAARIVASSSKLNEDVVTIGQWSQAKRNQHNSKVAESKQPAWNGEGLPPVGCECELVNFFGNDFPDFIGEPEELVKIIGNGFANGCPVAFYEADGGRGRVLAYAVAQCFRPIRTEAERKRDDRISTLNGFIDGFMKSTKGDHSNLGEALYEWLAVLDRLK